ncbi:MAG TPA: alpha/beta hydrolase domain-containing protein [Vicinamibacterales bacterium]|nr:alpha/beta hydrolase domain-containing protein [Vicinamibacterales bacterium]
MPINKFTAALALCLLLGATAAHAHIVKIEITGVEPAGPTHERITGKAYGELDPADPKNAVITDIELAPRNARGKVEYVTTFTLVRPTEMMRASGVLVYTVVNRGGGNATPHPDGHVTFVSGWQGDIVPTSTNYTIEVPVAKNRDGSSITGPLVLRFLNLNSYTTRLEIPRGQPSPYPPVSLDTTKATLISAIGESANGVKKGAVTIPSTEWAFADCRDTPFPGKPDPNHICAKNGFNNALLYELQYTVKDPLVLGIGLAATRDLGSFFRYEKQDASGTPNPVAGMITHAISEGSSQSGTFLRLSLLLGFNQDERGRIVWDGMNPHIAARFTDLNRRFAFPGGLVSPLELGHEGPAWWTRWEDTARKRPAASLLDRCTATNTCPKIAETFGSAEVWGLRQSFTLVGTTATKDIPIPDNVRRYYFPGVSHGGGPGGFATRTNPVKTAAPCALPTNPAPVGPMRTALISRLVAWVTKNTPMPASKYPTIADGTLVRNTNAAMGFPVIPGQPMPEGVQFPLVDYDLGPQFRYADQSGVLATLPIAKGTLPQLVVRVDADGNEVAGVKSPLLSAPLGTYTGWNVTTSGLYEGQLCGPPFGASPIGGFIPFAKTKTERTASGDPRLSLEERYVDHAGYVRAVKAAADKLVSEGYLLADDAAVMVKQAQEMNW